MLRARIFGGLVVEIDGRPLPPPAGLRARGLLAYFLVHPGLHERTRLAPLFWPDVLDTSARASLRGALWALRRELDAIGAVRYLVTDRRRAGIAPDLPREVDAERVGRLLRAGDAAALAEAAELAVAPLIPDLTDEWALVARDGHRDRLVAALERLGEEAERDGDLEAAVGWARRAIALDRLDERAHRALVRCLAASGRRSEALAAYRRCAAALAAELGVPPAAETRALAATLRDPRPRTSAPPRRSPRMVGREAELAALRRAWSSARTGAGGVAVLEGPAGIGKSRLAAELVAVARADGGRCAVGAALELEGGAPFAPWVEALGELAGVLPPLPHDAGWPADLARLSPALEARGGGASPHPPDPELVRARLFEAVAQMATWAGADAPLLLVLEDMHLADPASLALLLYLGRRTVGLPVMVLVTRRSAVTNPEATTAFEGLRRREALILSLRLAPLAASAIAQVVRDAVPALAPDAAARAAARAEGNPLLAREAARAIAAGRDPAEGLRLVVAALLANLRVRARLLVDLVAAAARPLTLGEAAALVGPDDLPEAIAAGVAADLLEPADDRRVRFTHALLREACYGDLATGRREWLHARLADVLGRRGCPSAEVARHLRRAGDAPAARDRLMRAAAEARAVGALDASVAYLREALELTEDDPALEAELLLTLADAEAWRGRREEWEHAVRRALELLRDAGDRAALAAAHVAKGGWLRTTVCAPAEALLAYRAALDLLDGEGLDAPELRALALAGCAWAEAVAGDPSRVPGFIARVEAMDEVGADPVLRTELALASGAALIRTGRLAEAESRYAAGAALAEAAGRLDLALVARANAASAAACRRDFARALELAGDGSAVARGGPALEAFVLAARAYALSRMGRHGAAREAAAEGIALAERMGGPDQEALAAFDAGAIALAAGRPGEAARRLARALEGRGGFSRPLARLLRAEALAGGDPAAAERELDRVPFEPVGTGDATALVPRMARAEALVAAARGDAGLALRRLGEAEAGWRRMLGGAAGEAFAATLVDLGRPPVAGLVEPGVEVGRCLADRARILAGLGRDEEAAVAAVEAARLADALHYDGYRDRLPQPAVTGEGS